MKYTENILGDVILSACYLLHFWVLQWHVLLFFFLSRFSFADTNDSQDSSGREGTIFYSTLPLPPAHKHSDIYLQLCMWDDYHVFLISTLVFSRLLLDEIYHLIELPFDWLTDNVMFVCLLDDLIRGFCHSSMTRETGELTSIITLLLQANLLTKCASHTFCWIILHHCFVFSVSFYFGIVALSRVFEVRKHLQWA